MWVWGQRLNAALNCDITGPLLHHKNLHYVSGKYSNVHVLKLSCSLQTTLNSVQHPGSSSGREEWERCRKAVQELLNLKYGKSFYIKQFFILIETSSPHSLGSWESQGKGAIHNPAALSSKEFSSRSEVWPPFFFWYSIPEEDSGCSRCCLLWL